MKNDATSDIIQECVMKRLVEHTRKKAFAQKEYRKTAQYIMRPRFKSPAVRVRIMLGYAHQAYAH